MFHCLIRGNQLLYIVIEAPTHVIYLCIAIDHMLLPQELLHITRLLTLRALGPDSLVFPLFVNLQPWVSRFTSLPPCSRRGKRPHHNPILGRLLWGLH